MELYKQKQDNTWNRTHGNNLGGKWERLPLHLDSLFRRSPMRF